MPAAFIGEFLDRVARKRRGFRDIVVGRLGALESSSVTIGERLLGVKVGDQSWHKLLACWGPWPRLFPADRRLVSKRGKVLGHFALFGASGRT